MDTVKDDVVTRACDDDNVAAASKPPAPPVSKKSKKGKTKFKPIETALPTVVQTNKPYEDRGSGDHQRQTSQESLKPRQEQQAWAKVLPTPKQVQQTLQVAQQIPQESPKPKQEQQEARGWSQVGQQTPQESAKPRQEQAARGWAKVLAPPKQVQQTPQVAQQIPQESPKPKQEQQKARGWSQVGQQTPQESVQPRQEQAARGWGKSLPPPEQQRPQSAEAKQGQVTGAWGKPAASTKEQAPPKPTWGQGNPMKQAAGPTATAQPSKGPVGPISSTPQQKGDSSSGGTMERYQLPPINIPNNYELLVVPNHPGKLGQAIQVYTNHFPLCTGNVKTIYQYDINITPMMSKGIQRIIMERARSEHYPRFYPAYDGRKTLISPAMLFKEKEAEVTCDFTRVVAIGDRKQTQLEEDIRQHSNAMMSKSYTISYKVVATLNIDNFGGFYGPKAGKEVKIENKSVVHALELVLRHTMSNVHIPVGRSIFYKPDKQIMLGSVYCLYRGIFQSINLGCSQAYLNVDVANKGFPIHGSMAQIWDTHKNESGRRQITTIDKWIKGLRVLVKYVSSDGENSRVYKALGFGTVPSKEFFNLTSGESMSVKDYFLKVKRVKLYRDDLPCLKCSAGKNTVMIPMEMCTVVPDQIVNKKMAADETRDMIARCATKSNQRMENIMQNIRRANYSSDPVIKNFDLKVSDRPQLVNARILPAPVVLVGPGDRDIQKPSKGAWRQNRMKTTATIREWSIIIVDAFCNDASIQNFIKLFKVKCKQYGISLIGQSPKVQRKEVSNKLADIFKYITSEDLVFVVIPDDNMVYSRVKTAAEIMKGVLTQCIKQNTMKNMKDSTLSNILLKVNAKLNGVNHDIKPTYPLPPNTMFMGADVTHPSPESNDTPSVAAVTACHDKSSFKYNIRFQMQAPGRELITNLDELVKDHLMYYKESNGTFPLNIIFYRDGVSNGQFKDVLNYELTAIRKAYSALCKTKPSITFVVVQKRHHTRLFPSNLKSEYNVDVGTCVDSEITSPNCQNFFLVSHTSFQGVVKPTKYVTLWDDHKFSNDQLESITYSLCHMFSRCTRSVSYPAPTYYAHLAAARAKCYVHNIVFDPKDLYEHPERYNVQLLEKIRKNLPMYFV
ncbi:PREDICTED: protein argonaute-3-like isoform X2 [Nicrophorus vespilloides]|uniref:Protein argonaute-3-like isoform X2 n=1 Tax=Nicrophorus vespilloides TaxID=110193 RepID=A0ABM1MJL5_NICVS|nr:PREDICTED: protein argonaute-3-like isoform X2 [Nicrophorus vespilloides]